MRLVLFLLSCALLNAEDVVYEKLFTDSTVLEQYIVVRNIGQTSHRAFVKFSNNGANVCVNPIASFRLRGSFDGSYYYTIDSVEISSDSAITLKGTQPYPYIQVHLGAFDNVNCVATGYYVGTMVAIPQEVDICDLNKPLMLTNGTFEFIGYRLGTALKVGTIFLNAGTDTATANIGYGPALGGCAPFTTLTNDIEMLKGNSVVIGSNTGSLFTLPVNSSLCIRIAAETVVTEGFIKYMFKHAQ